VARVRFLLRPRWLVSHLLVLVLVVTMVNLGFWQLRRLDEKRERNELIRSRMDEPTMAVGDLLDADDGGDALDAARYRRVTAQGRYDESATVHVRNRSQDGVAGGWLVTPLSLPGGERVGVVRGFVGLGPDGELDVPAVPGDEVEVSGLVVDPDRLDGTAARDLDPLLGEADVLPGLVLAQRSEPPEPGAAGDDGAAPADGAVIVAVPPPELSEGPHLAYAVQWFIFSTIAVVGYPLVLRRVVARRGKEVDDTPAGGATPGPGTGDVLDRELEDLLREGR